MSQQDMLNSSSRFRVAKQFATSSAYRLLPFRFIRLDGSRYVLTNFSGEYIVLSRDNIEQLVRHRLPADSAVRDELVAKHFVLNEDSSVAIDLLAAKYRTKQEVLSHFTSLFLFVVTLRCDHSCPYCQVSRQSTNRHAYDMSADLVPRSIEFLFETPAPHIKVEFQGGEPLLNFDLIRDVVLQVEERNETARKDLQFVIATNLAFVTDEILWFSRNHGIHFSTSLDGPRDLHNENRPRPGDDSYEKTIQGIQRVRDYLGPDSVTALMTTTEASLSQPERIVDEYVTQGFDSIFLRPMSPYGFAVRTGQSGKYDTERWLKFYRTALSHIIDVNLGGRQFREDYSTLLMQKILTPFPTGYVDLQSPAGIGISCVVFNYDGLIYASDEARMLAEMGDSSFKLGDLRTDSYAQVMLDPHLLEAISSTMTEGMPMCSDCGFQPYCGSDPVQHHALYGDAVGFKPTSAFCNRNMEVLRHLFRLLEDEPRASSVLKSWI